MGLNKTVYIDRKTTGEFTMSSKALDVKLTDLLTMIPDGAKILSMKFSNTNGRKLTVTIPSDNPLILTGGSTAAPTQALMRRAFAPITRFPTIHVEIPDLIAANIDTAEPTGIKAFSLATDGPQDVVICKFHYKMAI